MAADTATNEARALEAEALEYPDQRGEILLEAAGAWRRAGDRERSDALLVELIDAGGEDAGYARFERASALFADGRVDDARAELAALARDPELHDGHCGLVAELLSGRGDHAEALRWYDRLVARLTPDRLEALTGPAGWMSLDSVPLRGRRHVREQLGLVPDATDEIVPVAPMEGTDLLRWPATTEELRDHLDVGGPRPAVLRMLTFQRAERAEAQRRWPETYGDTTDDEYYPAAERRWREMADRGVGSIQVVPGVVADLAAYADEVGGSAADQAVRTRYVDTVPESRMIAWPPPRNARCWCASGRKYKQCCGRPA
jgi:tetratricopeptide (TPR) repeat protein